MPLTYEHVRMLSVAPGCHPRGLAFLSAASGLVRVRDRYYVVADDELHLGVFDADGNEPLQLVRLFEGNLPASAKKRKAQKRDLEALLFLPASDDSPGGSLLALGSGSRRNRFTGALLRLDARGEAVGTARQLDLEPLYADLVGRFDELNIEGAFVAGGSLVLLQRGVGRGASAAIRFDLADVVAWIEGRRAEALRARTLRSFDLGGIDGIPYAFTDGAALPDGSWVFSAVAEDRGNSYDDGRCAGAAIGLCGGDDTLRSLEALVPTRKVEGIEARLSGTTALLSLVTDADDPRRAAELGTTSVSWCDPPRAE
jgi:hypothetical protein